jgi:hypothetical protein
MLKSTGTGDVIESAIIVDAHNNPLTGGPVPFSRIPISEDYVRLGETVLSVSAVLFTFDGPAPATYVKVTPPVQGP